LLQHRLRRAEKLRRTPRPVLIHAKEAEPRKEAILAKRVGINRCVSLTLAEQGALESEADEWIPSSSVVGVDHQRQAAGIGDGS
jgi:hypothetical protein